MRNNQADVRRTDVILYHIITGIFSLLGRIPRGIAGRIADLLGRIWFAVDRRHRKVAVSNLTLAFGDHMSASEIQALARRVFRNLTRILFEIGWGMHLDASRVNDHFNFSGLHHLQAARRKGQGVLILTAHIGNWELMIIAAGLIGLSLSAIYRPLDFRPLDLFFADLRSRSGAKLFPKTKAMRKVLRSLKDGELVGVLLDQNTGVRSGVFVDFFGRPACTNKGLAMIALTTGAPVIPLFLVREGDGFRVEFGPEIPLIRTGDKTIDIETNTSAYNRVLESMIRRYPEQWFWVHRRWKTKPYKPWPRVFPKRKRKSSGIFERG